MTKIGSVWTIKHTYMLKFIKFIYCLLNILYVSNVHKCLLLFSSFRFVICLHGLHRPAKKCFSARRMLLLYYHVCFPAETEFVTRLTPSRQDFVLTSKNTSKNHKIQYTYNPITK